jgi:hypothetical protein
MRNPFDSKWPTAPLAINYVAESVGKTKSEACLELQRRLVDGSIRARGPITDEEASEIYSEFWRFAIPKIDGSAFNVHFEFDLRWFEVSAKDVLKIWPIPSASSKPISKRNAGAIPGESFRGVGAPPEVFDRVVQEMISSPLRSRLAEMKGEEMSATFRASRDTCTRARREVLSKNVDK